MGLIISEKAMYSVLFGMLSYIIKRIERILNLYWISVIRIAFTPFWVKKEKESFIFISLQREIWDINLKPPISTIGKLLETPLLRIYRKDYTIALSNSTRKDLLDIGFMENKVKIIPIAMKNQTMGKGKIYRERGMPDFLHMWEDMWYIRG